MADEDSLSSSSVDAEVLEVALAEHARLPHPLLRSLSSEYENSYKNDNKFDDWFAMSEELAREGEFGEGVALLESYLEDERYGPMDLDITLRVVEMSSQHRPLFNKGIYHAENAIGALQSSFGLNHEALIPLYSSLLLFLREGGEEEKASKCEIRLNISKMLQKYCAFCFAKDGERFCPHCREVRYCSFACMKKDYLDHKVPPPPLLLSLPPLSPLPHLPLSLSSFSLYLSHLYPGSFQFLALVSPPPPPLLSLFGMYSHANGRSRFIAE